MKEAIEKLGHRYEPVESAFFVERMDNVAEFDIMEQQLMKEEFKQLLV